MKIKKIEFQNFKSHGNNLQSINFDDEGKLILLLGENGTGKSSIKDVIDFSLYNKVIGKRKKYTSNNSLPNRLNKNLYTKIHFENFKGDDIVIKRCLQPNDFSIFINEIEKTEDYKNYSKEKKNNLLGYSYETFRSFISLSMNDFKNFIELKSADKTNLINKLFNIEKLQEYSTITKDYVKELDKAIELNYNNLETKNQLLKNTEQSINFLDNNLDEKIDGKINELKKIKEEYSVSQNKIEKEISPEIKELKQKYNNKRNEKSKIEKQIQKLNLEIENLNESIKIYENGKCPYCDTNLNTKEKINNKDNLIHKKNEKQEEINKLNNNLNEFVIEISTFSNQINEKNKELNSLRENLNKNLVQWKQIKNEKQELKDRRNNSNYDKLKKDYNSLIQESTEIKRKIDKLKKKKAIFKELIEIFEKSNIKDEIIKKSLKPINSYIKEFSKQTDLDFEIKLDDNFDAIINDKEIIDPETLSGGEDKKINIIIALSYLSFILDKKHCNILFIDELFNSIDQKNIDSILKLIKQIAKKYNLNIILIHHYLDVLDLEKFDKIIKTTKDLTSQIKVIE